MELFFGLVLLVLAAGMVVLFAMVGELASRVGDPASRSRSAEVLLLDQARAGHVPAGWPDRLAPLGAADRGILLVLSTVCNTCRQLAPEVAALADTGGVDGRPLLGVVVTCGNADSGAEFVATYGLDRLAHHVDVAGDWVQGEFDIHTSPAALLLAAGRVRAALLFDDIAALLARSVQILDEQQPEEVAR
ncbi:hypothetical protein ACQEVC_19765 [Plantactinospora sp. CA-294935]|uniref:hypothetical protein n=1 Tax=Plantactinospora sp. CA-294935 TaxID=3240012 RepID=UPI003D93FA1D